MKVTSDDLVRAVQNRSTIELATQMGWRQTIMDYNGLEDSRRRAAYYIAQQITLPPDTPTIPGAINGQPATFEIVYRAEDCNA